MAQFIAPNTLQQDRFASLPHAADDEAPKVTLKNPGYRFSGTINFDEEVNDQAPTVGTTLINGGGSVIVKEALAGHAKVLKLNNPGASGSYAVWDDYWPAPRKTGTIEFWAYVVSGGRVECYLRSGSGYAYCASLMPSIAIYSGDWYSNQGTFSPDAWHHCRITFDCAANHAWFSVDGKQIGGTWTCSGQASIDRLDMEMYAQGTAYFDAVGYSWDPAYKEGDNYRLAVESQTFPGTYSFTSDKSWTKTAAGSTAVNGGGIVRVVDSLSGHAKVLWYSNPGTSGSYACWDHYWPVAKTAGTIEFWAYVASGGRMDCYLRSGSGYAFCASLGSSIYIYSAGNWYSPGVTFSPDVWHHCRITFNCPNQVYFSVDGTQVGGTWTCSGQASIDRLDTWVSASTNCFLDALGYSWDGYTPGANLIAPPLEPPSPEPYLATIDFHADLDTVPDAGVAMVNNGGSVTVAESLARHAKVLKLNNPGASGSYAVWDDYWTAPQTDGTIEFWAYVASGGRVECYLRSGSGYAFCASLLPSIAIYSGDWYSNQGTFSPDAWHHCRITFDCAANHAWFSVDGKQIGGTWTCSGQANIDRLDMEMYTQGTTYFDAVGYSWDPAYILNDNVHPAALRPSSFVYDFASDEAEQAPELGVALTNGDGTVVVEDVQAGREKVLAITNLGTNGSYAVWDDYWPAPRTEGTIEFWAYVASGGRVDCYLRTGSGYAFCAVLMPSIAIYIGGTDWATGQGTFSPDVWHHCKIIVRCQVNLSIYVERVEG